MTRSLSTGYLLGLCAALVALVGPAPLCAQPTAAVDTFDLVLVGDDLSPQRQTVFLRSNPTAGDAWTDLDRIRCADTDRILILSSLATDRYLGQDLRENYIALKIASKSKGSTLRAVYAVPSDPDRPSPSCATLARLVESKPLFVRRHSIAVYERPRPAPLHPDTPFIDHVEAPVRHRKPGVLEVEWLDVLFGQGA